LFIICEVDSQGAPAPTIPRPEAVNDCRAPKNAQAFSYSFNDAALQNLFANILPPEAIQGAQATFGGNYMHLCQPALQQISLADATNNLQTKSTSQDVANLPSGTLPGDGLGCYSENLAMTILHELMHISTFDTTSVTGMSTASDSFNRY
jgi:hypothetical protein